MSERRTFDVVVIGGGLHGSSAALNLARRGLSVAVIEKDYVGRHASSVNAGGVRTLGRGIHELPLALASLDLWHDMPALVGADCGFAACGQIKLAESEADVAGLVERAKSLRDADFHHEEVIDSKEVYDLLPHLRPGIVGGLIARRDGYGNPLATMKAYRGALVASGVHLQEGVKVLGLTRGPNFTIRTQHATFECGAVVNAAGAWAGTAAGWLGDSAPVAPVASSAMITARMPHLIGPVVTSAARALSLKQFANGTVLISGGVRGYIDIDRNTAEIRLPSFAARAATTLDLFPKMRAARAVRFWAGIEATTPDSKPVIGPSFSTDNAFHVFGFNGHGFELGPAVGVAIADLVIDGSTSFPISAFSISRFMGGDGDASFKQEVA